MRVLNSQGDEQKYSVLFSFSQRSRKKIVHFCDIVPGVSFIPEDLDVLGVLLENQKPPKNISPLVSKSEGCFLQLSQKPEVIAYNLLSQDQSGECRQHNVSRVLSQLFSLIFKQNLDLFLSTAACWEPG